MDFNEMSKCLLDMGLFLNVYYKSKDNVDVHVYVLKGFYIKKYGFTGFENVRDHEYYDFIRKRKIHLNLIKIEVIEYPYCPVNGIITKIQKYTENSLQEIIYKSEYISNIKNLTDSINLELNNIYEENLIYFSEKNIENLKDYMTLRFFDEKLGRVKNIQKKLKDDILNKFFTCYNPNVIDDKVKESFKNKDNIPSFIPGLKKFGISKKNENNTTTK
jgi:hypothetical protein